MPGTIKDRYGMTLSTSSPAAADSWQEGIDLLLSQSYGAEEKLQEAIDLDEGFAIAHGCLAFMHMTRARPDQARESVKRSLELADGITDRERRHLEAVNLWANGKGPDALRLVREHLAECPRDAVLHRLAQRLFMLGCSGAGDPVFPPSLLALMNELAPHCGDDWAFLGQYAFAHHEMGILDKALSLAEKSLEMNPGNAVAAHSVTHSYFEYGDAATGGNFLGDWLEGFDARAHYHTHLSWHQALFELALGRYDEALQLYEDWIRPTAINKNISGLSDSASFMWRMTIYGGEAPPKPWDEVKEQAAPAATTPGAAFRDAHAALAFAASGDRELMDQMIGRLRTNAENGNIFAKEIVLPLAQGIDAFAQQDYNTAVDYLEPVFPQLTRIGGSHAQREVFEDTLLEAFLRAEQFDKAEDMLRERLGRRETPRDTFWLGRVMAGKGESSKAQDSLSKAAGVWQEMGDADTPELNNLQRLSGALT
ncbi:MAG: tetratricopeptide repeat protein [Chloroflexota bacterium]|nr:tetratricopeptide repeat protein [Chloroflexota bacterium]